MGRANYNQHDGETIFNRDDELYFHKSELNRLHPAGEPTEADVVEKADWIAGYREDIKNILKTPSDIEVVKLASHLVSYNRAKEIELQEAA
jgi:hypothetical protein